MKSTVKSWEFWVVVAIAGILLFGLYQVWTAAGNAVNSAVNAPGNAVQGVVEAGEGFLSWAWNAITGSGNSNGSNATQGANDQSYQGAAGSGSGDGSN